MKTVLLMDPIAAEGVSILKEKFQVVDSPDSSPATVRQLAREADGIIIRSKLPDDIFDAAPRVKAVAIHGTGTDLVPLEAASRRGVMVSNLPGVNAQSV
ncbi:MAG: hydroxyacid dehydrogenase, partial [Betaproteobacteria bacterium]|nr:hydroxyacid dehydrogenase [Betaproteobacteria bacterium]